MSISTSDILRAIPDWLLDMPILGPIDWALYLLPSDLAAQIRGGYNGLTAAGIQVALNDFEGVESTRAALRADWERLANWLEADFPPGVEPGQEVVDAVNALYVELQELDAVSAEIARIKAHLLGLNNGLGAGPLVIIAALVGGAVIIWAVGKAAAQIIEANAARDSAHGLRDGYLRQVDAANALRARQQAAVNADRAARGLPPEPASTIQVPRPDPSLDRSANGDDYRGTIVAVAAIGVAGLIGYAILNRRTKNRSLA